jgi:ATP-dependent DNA ligase
MSSLSSRTRRAAPASFVEPCLPSPADKPPSGANWIHEIKHDGYRLMARRDPVGIRLLTRRGNDWSARFPLVVEAVNHLRVRSCLIDGEVDWSAADRPSCGYGIRQNLPDYRLHRDHARWKEKGIGCYLSDFGLL